MSLTKPVLAYGLTGIADYSPEMPFIDLTKCVRPLTPNRGSIPATDPNGWPPKLPEGADYIRGIWAWNDGDIAAPSRQGDYVLRYEGQGEITLGGRGVAKADYSKAGVITFRNWNGGGFWFDIKAISPADPLRNVTVMRVEDVAAYDAGAIFNPRWLAVVAGTAQVRFMDWMETNGNPVKDWADRPKPGDLTYMKNGGVPIEVMVQLANEIRADPWFTIPIHASDDYVRQFANYVRDNLDPGLVAHSEYANEAWNALLPTFGAMRNKSKAQWGAGEPFEFYAKRATEVAAIWKDVFSAEPSRLCAVLGAHVGDTWLTGKLLDAALWKEKEPDAWVDPRQTFDAVASTTYFGHKTVTKDEMKAEMLAQLDALDEAQLTDWLAGKLADPDYIASIPNVLSGLAAQKELVAASGLRLLAYEGGQHVFQKFGTRDGTTPDQAARLTDFLTGFVRSDAMAGLYQMLWDGWAVIGDGPFMQYCDVSNPGVFGAWGARASLDEDTPVSALLESLNASTDPWWTGVRPGSVTSPDRDPATPPKGEPEADPEPDPVPAPEPEPAPASVPTEMRLQTLDQTGAVIAAVRWPVVPE